jgi:hypothetical protein
MIVDTPVATAAVAPFAAAAAPSAVAPATATGAAGGTAALFADGQLGPTYAEIKTVSGGTQSTTDCVASAPKIDAGTTYSYSFTQFPSI